MPMPSARPMSQACHVPASSSSRPPSVFSAASIDTLVADQSYRGFPSRDAYLTALRDWAESKMYYEGNEQLRGFYGTKTVENYLTGPGSRNTHNRSTNRRTTLAKLHTLPETESATVPEATADQAKPSRLKRVFMEDGLQYIKNAMMQLYSYATALIQRRHKHTVWVLLRSFSAHFTCSQMVSFMSLNDYLAAQQ
ncbi:hypothetical protein A1O1_04276 [Capronia coronata CBS 617.96]|uniref:Uncharacterized protein n=1 Tax=Capronia coronata CBS 617.96 TaxID=1182541 RepID=W9YE62_9EURO|nr:uncharacterized protein A1O1_04276 [Capronia coronata CBS 617.96]EXJ91167.1 hypothetical protein A1O1_04276 [Capronia coronata CBS 617.96]